MIVRGPRPSDNFAQISNAALADERLSFRARGVLAYLLSRPVGWSSSADALSEVAQEGRDAIRTALNELVDAGYLVRARRQTKGGQWVTDVHVTDSPTTGFQASVNQPSVDQAVKTKKDTQEVTTPPTPRKRGERAPRRIPYSPAFEDFWGIYPRKEGKQAAAKVFAFVENHNVDMAAVYAGARRYRDDPNREARYTKHAATWLNADGWLDDPLPARTTRMSANDAVAQTLALSQRLATQSTLGPGAGVWGQIGAGS